MTIYNIVNRTTHNPHISRALLRLLLAAVVALCAVISAAAHDPAKYASSSVLSQGKWGKVKVTTTGMQFVSAATLRELGFNDPTKVNVYGFGGRLLPDELRAGDPDDLPLLPSVKSSAGIWFFGHNHVRWNVGGSGKMEYNHTAQPYADESWYFISDREAAPVAMADAPVHPSAPGETSTFTQLLLHEQDLYHPSTSGRIYLGEDLRGTPNRKFNFTLTDKAADEFYVRAAFGSKSPSDSKFTVTPAGGAAFVVKNSGMTGSSADSYLTHNADTGSGSSSSENITIDVKFEGGNTVTFARLDFIEVAYSRRISLRDGQIYFPLNLNLPTRVNVANCEASTKIWDVTDPARPALVPATLSGSTATFIAPAGAREYVAFTPEKGGCPVSEPTSVANQDLHALNTPDMVIIAPYEYLSAANALAAHHRSFDGFTVHVLQPEPIYNEFSSGTPDVGAFRRLLKMWYDRAALPAPDNGEPTGRIGYCLIMSRPTYDNKMIMEVTRTAGYPRIPIWQSTSGANKESSYPCDDYIGMLSDFETTGTFNLSTQKVLIPVGRMPVRSLSEANAMVNKYINYVEHPNLGVWRNRFMHVADNNDHHRGSSSFDHFRQTESMIAYIDSTEDGRRFQKEKMYLDCYEEVVTHKGPTFPAAKERFLRLWNEGVNLITYIGHASTVEWTDEKLLEWNDIQNFSNANLPFLYAATCEFARYDQDTPCGAEVLWNNPQGGIIGTICPSRTVYITENGRYSNAIARNLFDTINPGVGRRVGDIMINAKNEVADTNRLRFINIGNPAMRFQLPDHTVQVTSLAGEEIGPEKESPVLPALGRSEIKGVIAGKDGSVATDFNGTVEIQLYDAEKVYETNDARVNDNTQFFNDHAVLLYRGLAKVVNGEWSTTLLIPMEIEDLYNTAKLTFYAYSDKGEEANGAFTDFYVYGFDENAPADDKGPEIHYFALNRQDFEEGGVVHTSPVVMAKISDESGINLSSLGIGHQITLTLDGNRYFDDVNTYYTPDNEDFTAGNLLYPLPELEAGEHTLRLTVWDNANNSASADLKFTVAASKRPEIFDLYTDVNPARDNVTFTLSTDRPMAEVDCRIEVFDLNGRKVWTSSRSAATDMHAAISVPWDLCTASGLRVPRGIYLYRATITSPDGTYATSSRKLAVTAQ